MNDLLPSQSEQDYLKAIYHLTRGVAAKERTGTTALADWLGVSCASATNMVKKMADRGLVMHSPYHGVTLTEAGEKAALEVLRHHRLLETYLTERLGVPWEQVHAEADRLEHALSEDLEARLDAALGYRRRHSGSGPRRQARRSRSRRSRTRTRRCSHMSLISGSFPVQL
jgi:DtxR family Mn-dependent transcriptional regulator